MDSAPKNLENNEALRALFKRDITNLKGLFSDETLSLVESNIDFLMKNYVAWQRSLATIAKKLDANFTNINNIPEIIEHATFSNVEKKLSLEKPKKIILGISGPGAVGKETIKTSLGFEMVVNTTTRPQRNYEKNGEHYHFVDDSSFDGMISNGDFVISMNRPGRGKYGIRKQDIENIFVNSNTAIIEENPVNLTSLKDYLKKYENCELILVYILPPSPVLPNLAARLASRCLKSESDFKATANSTLNLRQLEEFNSLVNSIDEGVSVLFIVNDSIDRVVSKIKDLIK